MIRYIIAPLLLASLTPFVSKAQTPVAPTQKTCGSDEAHRRMLLSDAEYMEEAQRFEQRLASFDLSQRDAGTLFVPVVVHVLETGTDIGAHQ